MKSNRLIFCLAAIISIPVSATGIDASINNAIQPLTDLLSGFIFYEVKIFEASLPLIVLWLIGAAIFFTIYFNFLNLRGFKHA
ncbi:alanine glycine permease, partial [Gammaproteobacteria bacterium]|nr:alanine glycine permease [Gammaproteobacteria bacterium]